MHTYELRQRIEHFISELQSFQPFLTTVYALSEIAATVDKALTGIAEGGERLKEAAGLVHGHFANTSRATGGGNHRQFYKALEQVQRCLLEMRPNHSSEIDILTTLSAKVEEFSAHYDKYLSQQTGVRALPLVVSARDLRISLDVLTGSLRFVEDAIGGWPIPSESEARLAIWLPLADYDLKNFARRLVALQSLYSELCMLFSVSELDHPLRVSKIESGSLWTEVFGDARIIELLVSFLEKSASWLYRSYTAEGKLSTIPRKVEAIDSLLGLRKRLADAGLNPSAMEPHIEKASISIAKDLSELLEGQPSVSINEHTISVGEELTKLALEKSAPLQLSDLASSVQSASPALPPIDPAG